MARLIGKSCPVSSFRLRPTRSLAPRPGNGSRLGTSVCGTPPSSRWSTTLSLVRRNDGTKQGKSGDSAECRSRRSRNPRAQHRPVAAAVAPYSPCSRGIAFASARAACESFPPVADQIAPASHAWPAASLSGARQNREGFVMRPVGRMTAPRPYRRCHEMSSVYGSGSSTLLVRSASRQCWISGADPAHSSPISLASAATHRSATSIRSSD